MADETAAQAGERIDQPHAKATAEREDGVCVGKQAVDAIHAKRERGGVKPPPALVAFQNVDRADVFATALRLDHHLGECAHIAQAEVQPLARDGVDAMRRIAHERKAGGGEAFGERKGERIGEARAGEFHLAQTGGEVWAERGEIGGVIKRLDGGGGGFPLAPDDRGVVAAGQRQEGEGTCGEEDLFRRAVVVGLVPERGDERGLAIAPALAADARAGGGARGAAIAAHEEAGRKLAARAQGDGGGGGRDLLPGDGFAREEGDAGVFGHGIQEGAVEVAVLEHEAHRAFLDLGAVEGEARGAAAAAIGGEDAQHGLHLIGYAGPDADDREQAARGDGQSIGATVETQFGPVGRGAGVNDGDGKAALGQGER